MMIFFFSSQFVTYRNFSSGENAIPLGPFKSLLTNLNFPSSSENTPLNGSSFRGSSKNFGNPNGGSVKNSAPSDRYTRSLGLFSRLPSNESASTVKDPSFSSRVTR